MVLLIDHVQLYIYKRWPSRIYHIVFVIYIKLLISNQIAAHANDNVKGIGNCQYIYSLNAN